MYSMYLLFLLFWIVLNGRVSLELTAAGCLIGLVLFRLAYTHLDYSLEKDLRVLRKLPVAVLYLLQLIREMVGSTLRVMTYVYSAKYEPEPQIVTFYVHFTTNIGMALMANYITLTPGTITVNAERNHFTVHCLDPEFAPDPEGTMVSIIKRLEER